MRASPEPFVVRAAQPADLVLVGDGVVAAYLNDLTVSAGYVEHLRDAATRAREAVLLVAVDGVVVLGSVTYALGGTPLAQRAGADEAELRMLGVAPAARGRGVATALVRECIDRARRDGARRIVLSTQHEMLTAQRLYQRLGFARRPDLDWVPEPGVTLLGYALVL